MKYTIESIISSFEKGKRDKFLFFWGHQKSKNGTITASCFSQWWSSTFVVDRVIYKTAEHWMMAQKALLFQDEECYNRILLASSPPEAKAIGRQVGRFDEKIWIDKREEIVIKGNLEKFKQNNELKDFLINTKDKVLVEASPVDKIWGIGLASDNPKSQNPKQWRGLNLLGFALMEVRDKLKTNT
jgi:hypothetical protein